MSEQDTHIPPRVSQSALLPRMQIQELGPYDLKEVLGKGGMGTVYRGVAKATGEQVAVKVLAPFYANHDGFRDRFIAEIRSLEKLHHPHIVTLHGYGEEEGLLFYVMELIPGNSLQDELNRGRQFHWREVCQIGADICGALKQAHDHGIIHRDIKPANLLLDEHDRAKLSDFGIAKLFGDTQMTVGGVLGTVDFMAPEQADGIPPTPRCDLYSMGAVLYSLLAGRAPFRGKTVAEVLQKLRYDEPVPVGRLNSETPPQLEAIIAQLLEKEPSDRIPTALALAKRLLALLESDTAELMAQRAPSYDVGFAAAGQSDGGLAELQTIAADEQSPAPLATQETQDPADEASVAAQTADRAKVKKYVTVDVASTPLDVEPAQPPESRLYSFLTWAVLLLGLGAVIFFVANALRPASANQLFDQITAARDSGDEKLLLHQSEAISSFIQRFPNDPRISDVQQIRERVRDQENMQRMLGQLRHGTHSGTLLENRIQLAMQMEASNPGEAAARYSAILELFDLPAVQDPTDEDERTQRALRQLAKSRLTGLVDGQVEFAQHYRDQLQQQLTRANLLAAEDPVEARRHWSGIVRLYKNDNWAKELVAEAERRLAEREE